MNRCSWCGEDPLYIKYHDEEWGVPVHDDKLHFEFLTLESAQAGLSWITILKKRENYREAFAGFDPQEVASFDEDKIAELLQDPGIVRNRLKVRAAVRNAGVFLDIQTEFGSFEDYVWRFVNGAPVQNSWPGMEDVPTETEHARALSKDLKSRGMSFVGPTIIYAHMQATGLVNDHITSCFRWTELSQ
mgnify:CR=1 FL=1